MKIKIGGLCTVGGAAILMSLAWIIEDEPFFWAWWIVAALCGCVVAMLEGTQTAFKLKVALPSILFGAAIIMTAYSLYYWYQNWINSGGLINFPKFVVVWGAIAALLLLIIWMIKQPEARDAATS